MDKRIQKTGKRKLGKKRRGVKKNSVSKKRPKYMMQQGPGFKLKEKPSAMKEKEMIEKLMQSDIKGITTSAAKTLYDICNSNKVELEVSDWNRIIIRYKTETQLNNLIEKLESSGFKITGKMSGGGQADLTMKYEEPKLITERPYTSTKHVEEPVQQTEEKPKEQPVKTLKLTIRARYSEYQRLTNMEVYGEIPGRLDKSTIAGVTSDMFRQIGVSEEMEKEIRRNIEKGTAVYDLEIEQLTKMGATFGKTKAEIKG
ncbi:MAG: hypothetical protein QXE90_03325 [Candidatus Micrarchaeia archaeon]